MAQLITCFKLTFLLRLVEFVVCFTPTVHYEKSANTIEEFVRIGQIPFEQCIDACLSRTRCNALLYRPKFHVCTLGSKVIVDVVPMSGSVLVSGFNEYHKGALNKKCSAPLCTLNETCVETHQGIHQCKVTECGPPMIADYNELFLGNMYNVGNILRSAQTPWYTTTCSPLGSWIAETADTGRIIVGKQDCMTLSTFPTDIAVFADVPVLCDTQTDGGKWLIFQRRLDGSENFYRGWDDYVDGFGKLSGEFWLGLEELHTIVSGSRFELRIDLEDFEGVKRYARYGRFGISDADDEYRLTVGSYSGDAGDAMAKHNGQQFSTYDNDNDKHLNASRNCASRYKSGWWYNACHNAHLNGAYYHGGGNTTTFANTIVWYQWKRFYHSLKKTEMKIRKLSIKFQG